MTPINQKSFYGKAEIINDGNISKLRSYDTIVAEYNHDTNEMKVHGYYSQTTARHISSFLIHFGFNTCNKKQLEKYEQ